MSVQPPQPPRIRARRRIPVGTWIGFVATALLVLVGLAANGFWGTVMLVSLVVLLTAVYGVVFRRTTWLRLPRKRSAAALGAGVALVVMIGSGSAFGATHPTPSEPVVAATTHASTSRSHAFVAERTPTARPTHTATPTPTPVVVTKTVTQTIAVPFASQTVQDATRAKGTSVVTTTGRDGVQTKTWRITTTDGVETRRTLVSDTVTTPPTAQVTSVGTYVAPPPPPAQPACTNGSYVNSAGNTICRPQAAESAPSGATAKCGDGTYSFSQSRSGTCSRHGGVAAWL
ncbi:surface rod structure-forming protein G [Curtobacterium flaccumfaciens]|uniref:Surface rod structure-forming protein G n=2 Tax=Curtobacterium flaccumfaciens TaxID=2035 RepID=A0A4R6DK25_9MICO|nr:surface rod structure-forming protein G [Curtobacterium flaccumfaciens]